MSVSFIFFKKIYIFEMLNKNGEKNDSIWSKKELKKVQC